MWHSLPGLKREKAQYLDFEKCYPHVRDAYQPKCIGLTVRVQGKGRLKLEFKPVNDDQVLWSEERELDTGNEWRELPFSWESAKLRKVKFLNWVAESGAQLCMGSIKLVIEFPKMPFE